MDETGLFFKALPKCVYVSQSHIEGDVRGSKKMTAKARCTVVLCTNATGTCGLYLLCLRNHSCLSHSQALCASRQQSLARQKILVALEIKPTNAFLTSPRSVLGWTAQYASGGTTKFSYPSFGRSFRASAWSFCGTTLPPTPSAKPPVTM